jgi:hypothetical protein
LAAARRRAVVSHDRTPHGADSEFNAAGPLSNLFELCNSPLLTALPRLFKGWRKPRIVSCNIGGLAVPDFTAMNSAASLKSHVCLTNVSITEVNSSLAAPKGEPYELKSH